MAIWSPQVCSCIIQTDSDGALVSFIKKVDQHSAMSDANALIDIKQLCADASELIETGFVESTLSLADLKTARIDKIKKRVAEYMDNKYNSEERDSFIIAGLLAQNAGNAANFNAVKPVYDWILSVYQAQKVAINLTKNAANKAAVKAVSINYAALTASKPSIKLWDVI